MMNRNISKLKSHCFIVCVNFILLFIFWPSVSYSYSGTVAANNSSFTLTKEEKSWLAKHPEISVGVMNDWPPFNFVDKKNKAVGIGIDYLTLLNKRLGGVLKPVPGNWDNLYQKVKDKQLDALMDITPKAEREEFFNFTQPYLDIPHIIVARKSATNIPNEDSLMGKSLALESGFGNVKYFQENYPQIQIKEYKNTRAALNAVAIGEADAYAGNRSTALYIMGEEAITNLKVHGRLRKSGSILSFGVRKNAPMLNRLLDRALTDIKQREIREIHSRWTGEENSFKQVNLTNDEQLWLKLHPSIKIAFDANYPPYSYQNEQGEFVGIAVDIAKELAVRAGIQLDIYPDGQWQHIYAAAQNTEIDVIATMVKRGNRENWFAFTRPYLSLSQYIITQKDNLNAIQNKSMLAGKTVALVKDYSTTDLLLEEIKSIKPYFVSNLKEALEAVSRGDVDATVGDIGISNHYISKVGLINLGFAALYTRNQSKQRFAIRKDWRVLATILDKTMETLSYPELMQFYARWNMPDIVKPESGFLSVINELTEKEKTWLDQHSEIRLASDSFWPPFESIDNRGQYAGIAADYMKLIEKRLGIKFITSPKKPWAEITQMLKNKELDVFSCAMETEQRKDYAQFTSPYISHPMVIVTKNDVGYIDGLTGLIGKTIAIEQGYASYEILTKEHPELLIRPYSDSKSAMLAVSQGEVFSYIGNIATMSYVIRDQGITNIKVSGQIPYKYELAIGVRNDWQEFVPILEKTLDSISLDEKNAILQKWISVDLENQLDTKLLLQVIGISLFIFFVILYWNRKLSNEVHQRKQVESKLRENQAMLEQRSDELIIAMDEAKRANAAKSDFLSSMSHELRTPMNSILGFSELLTTDQYHDEETIECATEILKAGQHLLELINEVLDLSKVESGHIDFSKESVNVSQVIDDCFIFSNKLAEQNNIKISHSIPSSTSVIADHIRLKQILLNLISNAIKYNRNGGTVKVSVEPKPDNILRILVTDTGKGIPSDRMGELFAPFNRLDAEHSDIEGTGIGLTFSRRLVELLDGRIGVDSVVGEGSSFWVEFPLDLTNENVVKNIDIKNDNKQILANETTHKILYIDDNSANLKLVSHFLNRHKNIKLFTAETPGVGIELATKEMPDIILLDLNMPEMDGYQVLDILKTNKELKNIPVIAITAKAMPSDIEKSKAAGFIKYLTKPLSMQRFYKAIDHILKDSP